jgi:hypothetical protein
VEVVGHEHPAETRRSALPHDLFQSGDEVSAVGVVEEEQAVVNANIVTARINARIFPLFFISFSS